MTEEPDVMVIEEEMPEDDLVYDEELTGSGWRLFAGMMLFGVSMMAFMAMCIGWEVPNLLQFTAFGMTIDWIWYGIFDGLTAVIAFLAAGAVWQGMKIGYYAGLIIATLSAGRWFLFIPAVPFWGVVMAVVWLLVVFGLIRDRNSFS